ncbi:FecR family protein [Luteimonas sp. SDU101]|uniref:FecR family protein n=1 Tax=Luteimonas sp. SDU101 TaxID=3422593 RepID=UPI003EB6EAD5
MDSHRDIERIAADWLARRGDAGRAWTDADQRALDAWLSASTAHQVAYIRLDAVWQQADRLKALGAGVPSGEVPDKSGWRRSPFFAHRSLAASSMAQPAPTRARTEGDVDAASGLSALRFRSRSGRPVRRRGLRLAGAAACVLLAATVSLGGWYRYAAPTEAIEFSTAFGDVREVPLPDGSAATLSSDTRLRMALTRRARRIELEHGEAYFQVVADAGRPFIVQVGETRLIAVGTRFAVRAESGEAAPDGDRTVRVVVTEGAVRLEPGGGVQPSSPPPLLTAGVVAMVRGSAVQVESGSPELAERALGWRTGDVVFSATPLAEAAAEFNRHNARRIVIDDPALAQMRVDGGFRIHNVDGFVRLLEVAFDVEAERTDDRVVLRRR